MRHIQMRGNDIADLRETVLCIFGGEGYDTWRVCVYKYNIAMVEGEKRIGTPG